MTTKYGERPGITNAEALAVDGDREYWRGKVAEVERERDTAIAALRELREATRACDTERDEARADAARLREVLRLVGWWPDGTRRNTADALMARRVLGGSAELEWGAEADAREGGAS